MAYKMGTTIFVKCKNCGMQYISVNDTKCPLCKVIKNIDLKSSLDSSGNIHINVEKSYKSIVIDKEIYLHCKKCNTDFPIKGIDFNNYIKFPECPECGKFEMKEETEEMEKPGETNKTEETNETGNFDISETKLTKVKKEGYNSKGYFEISKYIGQVYGKTFRIESVKGDKVDLSCINCGDTMHTSTRMLSSLKSRKVLGCKTCKERYGNKNIMDKIASIYLGKIYNNLIITNIYCDENGITQCDLSCVRSRATDKDGNIIYNHSFKGIYFGDVLNHKFTCLSCGKRKIKDDYNLKKHIINTCAYFASQLTRPKIYETDSDKLTINDFYSKDSKLCDYCGKTNCNKRNSGEMDFNNIRNLVDREIIRSEAIRNVSSEFPNIYSPKNKKASNYNYPADSEILIFRKAYTGRDGQDYRFCKCLTHGTEFILSELDIQTFEHKQCLENNKISNKFFNIDESFLPILV